MATNTRDAAGTLPDELLLDIFLRLSADPVDLLRCAATCTRWLRLLAADDAAFLPRSGVLPENRNASVLLGAFYQTDYLVPGAAAPVNKISDCPPRFWRLDDPSGPGFSILPKHNGLFNHAKPLASRRGLLLVRLMPPPLDYRKLHLAVCHPLIGGVHHLPLPPKELHPWLLGRDVTGYALLPGYGGEGLADHRQRRLAFRVLITTVYLDGPVYAYSYSSATGSWSAPTLCPLHLRHLPMSGPRAGVVDGRGTTHWLYRDTTYFYTLDVRADAARVSSTKLPILVDQRPPLRLQPPFPCIAQGGKLSLVFSRPPDMRLRLCTKPDLQNKNNQDWTHSELPRPFTPFDIIGFAEGRGAILVKSYRGLSCLDLERKELELVRGSAESSEYPRDVCSVPVCQGYYSCTHCTYNKYVLYEMDWSSYLLHISAWSPRGATR